MGFFDKFRKAKDSAQVVVDKAQEAVDEHAPQLKEGIHKAADFVDEKTGHRFSGGVDKTEDAAEAVVDRLGSDSQPESAEPDAPAESAGDSTERQQQ